MSSQAVAHGIQLKAVVEDLFDHPIPIIEARITAGANQPAQASITVPAVPEATEIPGRTLVTLFFRYSDREEWKLLFAGELIQDSIVYDRATTSVGWTLVDLSHYWSTMPVIFSPVALYLNFFDPTNQAMRLEATYVGGAKYFAYSPDQMLLNFSGYFYDLTSGLQTVVEKIADKCHPKWYKSMIAYRKFQKILYAPDDDLLKYMFGVKSSLLWKDFMNNMGKSQMILTAGQIVHMFLSSIGYGTFPNPISTYISDYNITEKGKEKEYFSSYGPASVYALPRFFLGIPPRCNVITPSMLRGLSLPRYKIPVTRYACIYAPPAFDWTVTAGCWPFVKGRPWTHQDTLDWEWLTGPNAVVRQLDESSRQLVQAMINSDRNPPLHGIAAYYSVLERLKNRRGTAELVFNPYLVVGMPVILLVKYHGKLIPHIGQIVGINHDITAFSGATTSVEIDFCHVLGEDLATGVGVTGEEINQELAIWLRAYKADNDWSFYHNTYKKLIKVGSILGNPLDTMKEEESLARQIKDVKTLSKALEGNWYKIAKNRILPVIEEIADYDINKQMAYIWRPIATEDQIQQFFFGDSESKKISREPMLKEMQNEKIVLNSVRNAFILRYLKAVKLYAALQNKGHTI